MIFFRTLTALGVILAAVGCTPPQPRMAASSLQGLRTDRVVGLPLTATISYLQSANPQGATVIWVHGTPGDAEGWADYVLEPIPGTLSIALDRPGFGHSEPQGAVTRLELQAAAVEALFPPATQKVVLVGHSLGGAVVAYVAGRHPDRVQALVLLAASLDPSQEVIHPMQHVAKAWPLAKLLPRTLRNANDELMAFKTELLALQNLLASISAPTVIVHGTKDDLVPFANVAYIQSRLVGARCVKTVVLEGQNHFLPWNAEAVVRDAVTWAVLQGTTHPMSC